MKYIVYCHIFPNGKKYVGITCQSPEKRWRNGKGYKGQIVYNPIKKYGWHNIAHKILYSGLTREEAEETEKRIIFEWKTNDRRFGYNIESGGNIKKEVSAESRKKNSIAHIGLQAGEKNGMYGTHRCGKNNPFYGRKHSEETKQKISEQRKGRFCSGDNPVAKKVICIETQKIYLSMKDACRENGINPGHLTECCKGTRKKAGGYHWSYAE